MKKCTLAILALVAAGFTAQADTLNVAYDQDMAYPINAWVDWHSNDGTAWPNFRVEFPEGNGTEEDGALFTTGDMTWECTGPDGYTWSNTVTMGYGAGVKDAHGYMSQGYVAPGEYTYNIKLVLHYADETKGVLTETESGTVTVPKGAFVVSLALEAGEFTRTSSTGGTLPYTITATGDVDQIDHYVMWASRVGDENMDETNVTDLEGNFVLTALPENATTGVWLKVKAVSKDGQESGTVQVGAVNCDTRDTEVAFSYTLSVEEPGTALSATTGELKVTINAVNYADVESYNVFCVRAAALEGETGDVEVGRVTVNAADIDAYPYTFTLPVSGLLESAETNLWVKSDVTGVEYPQQQFPGEAQGWAGLNINTSGFTTAISTVADANAPVDVYNVAGVRVRTGVNAGEATRNLPAGLYIIGGKKVIVR